MGLSGTVGKKQALLSVAMNFCHYTNLTTEHQGKKVKKWTKKL